MKSAEAYEILRSQALHPEDHQNADSDRVIMMREGMVAWIRKAESYSPISPAKQKPVIGAPKSLPSAIAEEVAGLIAEIIIKSERFTIHA